MTQVRLENNCNVGWHPATGFGLAGQRPVESLEFFEIVRVAQMLPLLICKAGERLQAKAFMCSIQGGNLHVLRGDRLPAPYQVCQGAGQVPCGAVDGRAIPADRIEQAADIFAIIAEDLGDAEL